MDAAFWAIIDASYNLTEYNALMWECKQIIACYDVNEAFDL